MAKPPRIYYDRSYRYIPDALDVECWCRSAIVAVPIAEIRQILTRSCSKPDCGPHLLEPSTAKPSK